MTITDNPMNNGTTPPINPLYNIQNSDSNSNNNNNVHSSLNVDNHTMSNHNPMNTTIPIPTATAVAATTSINTNETDEEMARRLQTEETMKSLRDLYASNGGTNLTTTNNNHNLHNNNNNVSTNNHNHNGTTTTTTTTTSLTDEEYARRLEQELHDKDVAMAMAMASDPSFNTSNIAAVGNNNHSNNTNHSNNNNHVQQEENDRMEALRLQEQEQELAVAEREQGQGNCTKRRVCNALGILTILTGGVLTILLYAPSIWTRAGGDPNDLPPFFRDTWQPPSGGGQFSQWQNGGKGGLELTIINALTPEWHDHYEASFHDWNEAPALSLTSQLASTPDPDCAPVRGAMKVCNKKYGRTGWTGLNEVYSEGAYITSSVAKMNESYLENSTGAERRYVMCHEMGHGFGLPHRDEITTNPDLGTCLDYTRRPENNLRPDAVDYGNLESIYGLVVSTGKRLRRRIASITATTTHLHDQDQSPMLDSKFDFRNGRLLFRSEFLNIYE
eukprot:CAMPEP_0184859746 /NCGR_PEP_ID=MMETSP0580-20130426/4739_1 /TAXON_ID=1118495 /ORGANISM="Dactyliosolen fragilissimus" /LENGTH=500 /DNA_ID=CAMNT_0027356561 /DNA_START=34 /DNA_END=1533 /DNA_ORIENTATION=+